MEWIKVENPGTQFKRCLHAGSAGEALSLPAKEMPLSDSCVMEGKTWTEYTLIRIAKGQSAVVMEGDRILASCGRVGDYQLRTEEDVSKAKVYFVRTRKTSSKVYEVNTGIVYPEKALNLGVEQDVRLRSAFYFDYRIKNPKTFIRYMAEQKQKRIPRQIMESELYSVFSVCIPEVLAQLSREGISYSQLCRAEERLTQLLAQKLALAWPNSRGIELITFAFVKAKPYKVDEKAFIEKCRQAERETSGDFSEEFSKLLQGLGQVAGKALNAFQGELASLFGGLEPEEDEEYDDLLNSILNNSGMDVLGSWICPELKQIVTFALLDAAVETDGKEVWRGDWEQIQDENGNAVIVCPTADSLGCYARFEHHTDPEEEYLAGILTDTGIAKQYVRFLKMSK